MKNKIYTISLLLSFLIILIHDAIPHHHESDSLVKIFCWNPIAENAELNYQSYHLPLEGESKQPLSQEGKCCEKDLPLHHHIAVTDNFSYVRSENVDVGEQIQIVLSFLCVIELFSCNFTQYSVDEVKRFSATGLLATSQFIPGTIFLRGPPVLS